MTTIEEWRRFASDGNIEEAIWCYVRDNDWTIFPDLQTDLAKYLETEGNYELRLGPHTVLWGGLSERMIKAIVAMIKADRIALAPISKTVYTLSGVTLPTFPVEAYSKSMAEPKVKSWVPVCFRLPPYSRVGGKKKNGRS